MVSGAELWGAVGVVGAALVATFGLVTKVVTGRLGHIEEMRIGAATMTETVSTLERAVDRLERRAERDEAERREIREALAKITGLLDGFESRIKSQVNEAVLQALKGGGG